MTSQYDQPEQSSKWRQYVGPIIILVLAVGLAIYGLMWASDDENALPTDETTTTEDAGMQDQPDASGQLEEIQQQYPDAESEEQEALAAAQAEMDMYLASEVLLQRLLTDPDFEYGFSEDAAEFAVDNVQVDWNEQAYEVAVLTREDVPDATDEELSDYLQNDPDGPQFTAEQTEYAMSQLE